MMFRHWYFSLCAFVGDISFTDAQRSSHLRLNILVELDPSGLAWVSLPVEQANLACNISFKTTGDLQVELCYAGETWTTGC